MPESKRAARAAARATERKAKENAWQAVVERHFDYLRTRYGFHVASVDASSWWQTRLVYQTGVLAVAVDRSVEFNRVEVCLIRLVDGAIPPYPIFITPDTAVHYFWLDSLLAARAPHLIPALREVAGLRDEQIEHDLKFLASAVEKHAADVLRGDFAIFGTLAAHIKARAREHPQEITLLFPEGTPPEEIARAEEKTRRDNPTQPVVVRIYRRRQRATRRTDESGGSG